MDAEAAGYLAHARDCLVTSLANDIRRAELSGECDPVGVTAEDDDLLCAESPRGDDAAQADGAVPDDRYRFTGADLGGDGCMMACTHHV